MHPPSPDMSILGLIMQADLVVKLVMLSLVVMSIWCWTIIFEKWLSLRSLNQRAAKFEEAFWASTSLDALYDRVARRPGDPLAVVFAAGMAEWRRSVAGGLQVLKSGEVKAGLKQRIDGVMGLAINREMAKVERRLSILASVGSTGPFVGLFGTVWGIMNSFIGIAEQQNTNLAVVAPGIAEALIATAMGLVAAIPASLAYNKFSGDLGRYADRLYNFSTELSTILSRHMEEAR